jgi:hypothetical protein
MLLKTERDRNAAYRYAPLSALGRLEALKASQASIPAPAQGKGGSASLPPHRFSPIDRGRRPCPPSLRPCSPAFPSRSSGPA